MERKDLLYAGVAELAGLIILGAGVYDRNTTPMPAFESPTPDPSYRIVFNTQFRLRSTFLIGAGAALSLSVPMSMLAATHSNKPNE